MSWIFALAIGLILLSVFCFTSSGALGVDGSDGTIAAFITGLVLLLVGLLTFQFAVQTEVNCYRDGGQVVNTQCVIVKGAVNGND